jgi:glycosyltransferase involved in cell wall biosynthesis
LRILFVTPYFYPATFFGGPVSVAFDVGRELTKRGHEVVVYTSDAKDLNNRLGTHNEIEGIDVHYFRNLSMFLVKQSKLFITPSMFETMASELKSFDIVHVHEYTTYQNIIVHKLAKKYDVPYVLQAHGSLPKKGRQARKWLFNVFFGSSLLRDASRVIALSDTEAEQYKIAGVPTEKIVTVPNGIDLSQYSILPPKGSFKKKFDIKDDERMLLYLGRIHESKGLDILAYAFRNVLKKLPNLRLVVVGPDDGYLSTFSSLISDLSIDKQVTLTGFVKQEDKLAALNESEVFVTPCFSGFPITFLEAILMSCPIITTSTELNWIHNNVGCVVKRSSVDIAYAIVKILQDSCFSNFLRRNCKSVIENYDISKTTSKFEELYQSLVN